jgi:F-type H+-transporting ATPase subunit delta
MHELINSPHLTETQLADLFIQVAGGNLNANCANFVRVLASNGRLLLLPEIAALFEIDRRAAEGTVQAQLVTAFPASESQQAEVIASLRKRLGREVELSCSTDAELLGGAIIRAGDLVIDGSVRGKLQRLGTALAH